MRLIQHYGSPNKLPPSNFLSLRATVCCQLMIPDPTPVQNNSYTDVGKVGTGKANATVLLPQQGAGCLSKGQARKEKERGLGEGERERERAPTNPRQVQ